MSHLLSFAINHMVVPRKTFAELVELTTSLGLDQVEIRNDLPGVAIADGTDPARIRDEAAAGGVRIRAINALQRFNDWNDQRASEAIALARYARDCGAEAVVLCPVGDASYRPSESERQRNLRHALRALAPILAEAGIVGMIEPLGFAESSLRLKADAVEAIEEQGLAERFRIVHDTFHHYLTAEARMFPEWTGLVHLSGVDENLPLERLRDEHRELVGADDILGNIGQIVALMEDYDGPYAFEAFAPSVHATGDIGAALESSMHWIDREIARLPV
ncbi:MAG: TIM barrel protein [Geminicoccaceae bacterium]